MLGIVLMMSSCEYHFRDDFSRYKDECSPEPVWRTTGFAWTVRGGKLIAEDPSKTFVLPDDAPHGKVVSVEATLSVSKTTGKNWKTAGVTVFRDKENYWHLALAESPDSEKGVKRHIELIESLDGKWLANVSGASKLPTTGNVYRQICKKNNPPTPQEIL